MSKTKNNAHPAQAPASADAAAGDMAFEEAAQKLEAIVEAMERGDLPLETMLAQFEEGVRLSAVCQAKLNAAEGRIQQLEKNAEGGLSLRPLDAREGVADA